ncbi:MAG: LacI family transcriptional regulator [Spirochaetia bacterium]|nr:LacI family transcriptional regulator [Spirochaetia bacterium]MCF7953562.1 LacI family transcriptional regulator [Spirochaetales bacterium]
MAINISDVAEHAGVSIATVSRIINNLPGYSEKTKERVENAIKELGYKPNAVARGLVSSKTGTIGVLLPCVTGRFSSELLRGIEKIAHSKGYSVIICNTDMNGERTMSYLQTLSEKRVEGILFISEWVTPEYGEYLSKLGIPVVLVATHSQEFPFPSVRTDDFAAAYTTTKYLINKGHTRIGLISGDKRDRIAGKPRIDGYKKALDEAGLDWKESFISYGDFHFESGIASMALLDARSLGLTAVFATSDEMALGAMTYLHRRGISVPDELSLVGYDDTLDAVMSYPSLTALHQPIEEMGECAMDLICRGVTEAQDIVLEHYIVERDSVKELE